MMGYVLEILIGEKFSPIIFDKSFHQKFWLKTFDINLKSFRQK